MLCHLLDLPAQRLHIPPRSVGKLAQVEYVGLTPGVVRLFQTNFTLPTLAPGTYAVVVTIGGVSNRTATREIRHENITWMSGRGSRVQRTILVLGRSLGCRRRRICWVPPSES